MEGFVAARFIPFGMNFHIQRTRFRIVIVIPVPGWNSPNPSLLLLPIIALSTRVALSIKIV